MAKKQHESQEQVGTAAPTSAGARSHKQQAAERGTTASAASTERERHPELAAAEPITLPTERTKRRARSATGLATPAAMRGATESNLAVDTATLDASASATQTSGASAPVERAPVTTGALGSSAHGLRRARTLGDVVQPSRLPTRGPSGTDWQLGAQIPTAGVERPDALADTLPTVPGVRPSRGKPGVPLEADLAGQPRDRTAKTRPLADADETSLPIPVRQAGARLTRRLSDEPASRSTPPSEPEPRATARTVRPERLGAPQLVLRVALAHACAELLMALGASVYLLNGNPFGYWLLGFVALALPGAVLAFLLIRRDRRTVRFGAGVLVATQVLALALAFALIGPSIGLVTLVPAGVWLAHRLGGRPVAWLAGLGATLVTLASVWGLWLGLLSPVATLSATGATVLATVGVTLGLGCALVAVLDGEAAREKGEFASRARLYELRLRRAEASRARSQIEHESEVLGTALVTSLHSKGIEPITLDGPLGPVAEITNAVAERLSTLQKDREDRIRQEGALRMVITAMERGWLGLPWTWPEPSGTTVDELVALLRTPRPRERRTTTDWLDEMPTFVQLPTLSPSGDYWRSPLWWSNLSAPSYPSLPAPDMSQGRFGWDDLLSGK